MRSAALVILASGCVSALLLLASGRSARWQAAELAGGLRLDLAAEPFERGVRLTFRACAAGPLRGGLAYDRAAGMLYAVSEDGFGYAISFGGVPSGRVELGARTRAAPTLLEADRIVVGDERGGLHLWASGGLLPWAVLETPIELTPVADGDGGLLVAAGRTLVALDRQGRERFRFSAYERMAPAAVASDGVIYVGSDDDRLYILDSDGSERAHVELGADVAGAPLAGPDGAFVGLEDGRVVAIAASGELRWSTPLGGAVRAPLARTSDGSVLATSFGPRPRLAWLDPEDGHLQRELSFAFVDGPEAGVRAAPLVLPGGDVVAQTPDDYLVRIDAFGSLRWSAYIGAQVEGTPVALDAHTFAVAAQDGCVHAFRELADVQGDAAP